MTDRGVGAKPGRTTPDPRPAVERQGQRFVIRGKHCLNCGHHFAVPPELCRLCHAEAVDAHFGPGGTVWASTVVWISAAGRNTPYTLAYIDLASGPRILAHVDDAGGRLFSGQRVELTGQTPDGDPLVRPIA
jgi:uncharacterized OB-fold protein